MGRITTVLLLIGMSLLSGNALAAAQYSYTGSTFTDFNPASSSNVFWPSGFASGTFTVDAPLPGNLSASDISGDLSSYRFSAGGGSVLTEANSLVVAFRITTDGSGNITGWLIWVSSPVTAVGDLADIIELRNPNGDIVYENSACLRVTPAGACNAVDSPTGNRAQSDPPGNWRLLVSTVQPVPFTSHTTLIVLAIMFALLLGFPGLRRRI